MCDPTVSSYSQMSSSPAGGGTVLPLALIMAKPGCSAALAVFALCEGAAHAPARTSKKGEVKPSQSGRFIGIPLFEVPPASSSRAPSWRGAALSLIARATVNRLVRTTLSAAELVRELAKVARENVVTALRREVGGLVRSVLGG